MAKKQIAVQANWLLGKKIVGVETVTNHGRDKTRQQEIIALTLDDGSRLAFLAYEGKDVPFVSPVYKKGPGRGMRKTPKPQIT